MSTNEINSRMSSAERAKRRAAVGKAASEKIAKSEQLNFRIEEKRIAELQDMAATRGMPVGTMIREWVLDRLAQEKLRTPQMTGKALHILEETYLQLHALFGTGEAGVRYNACQSDCSAPEVDMPAPPDQMQ